MTRSNPAWHRGYDEGAASAKQDVTVCAPPEEYDGEAATEFMAGFHTGLNHARDVTDRDHALPPEKLILTPPGGLRLDEREIGYRHAMAVAWRAIQHAQTAQECRLRIVELGQGPAPDLSGPPRQSTGER